MIQVSICNTEKQSMDLGKRNYQYKNNKNNSKYFQMDTLHYLHINNRKYLLGSDAGQAHLLFLFNFSHHNSTEFL